MIPRRVCFLVFALAALTVLVLGEVSWLIDPIRASAAEEKDARVKALLKELHAVLQKIATAVREQFHLGLATVVKLNQANLASLHAELDLCDTDKERIAVLERMLEGARYLEKQVKERVEVGRATDVDLLRAMAGRGEIEFALERIKAR